MSVIVDVIFAVAEIAVALRAVSEFQLRMGNIGSAADHASVLIIRCFWLWFLYFHRSGCTAAVDTSSPGEEIADIKENKVICQGNQREQAVEEVDKIMYAKKQAFHKAQGDAGHGH